MEKKKRRKSTIIYFQSCYLPEQIWEYLTHPKYAVNFTKEPCYYNEINSGFKLEKGNHWTEIHTGEDCKGDKVLCKIEKSIEYETFVTIRNQTGIKNTTIYKLEQKDTGTLISEEQKFALTLRNFKPLNLVTWILLATGLLTKFSFKPEDDEYWFKKMEEKITQSKLNSKSLKQNNNE